MAHCASLAIRKKEDEAYPRDPRPKISPTRAPVALSAIMMPLHGLHIWMNTFGTRPLATPVSRVTCHVDTFRNSGQMTCQNRGELTRLETLLPELVYLGKVTYN